VAPTGVFRVSYHTHTPVVARTVCSLRRTVATEPVSVNLCSTLCGFDLGNPTFNIALAPSPARPVNGYWVIANGKWQTLTSTQSMPFNISPEISHRLIRLDCYTYAKFALQFMEKSTLVSLHTLFNITNLVMYLHQTCYNELHTCIAGRRVGIDVCKVKSEVSFICIAVCYELLISKALRYGTRSHSFTCHPHVYPQVECALAVFKLI